MMESNEAMAVQLEKLANFAGAFWLPYIHAGAAALRAQQSLRASGFRLVGQAGSGSWSRTGRPRVDKHPTQPKLAWSKP